MQGLWNIPRLGGACNRCLGTGRLESAEYQVAIKIGQEPLSRGLRYRIQQSGRPFGQSVSNLHDTDYSGVLLAPFDHTDVVAV